MGSDNPEPLLLGQTQSPNGLKRSGWMNHGTKALVVHQQALQALSFTPHKLRILVYFLLTNSANWIAGKKKEDQ